MFYTFTNAIGVVGFAMAALGRVRWGPAFAALAFGGWTVGFALDGFATIDVVAAGATAAGLLASALVRSRLVVRVGAILGLVATAWYFVDNAFLAPLFVAGVPGSVLYVAGCALLVWRGGEPGA